MKKTITVLLIMSALLYAHPGKIVKGFKINANYPVGLTFDGKQLWLSDYKLDRLIAINPENGAVITTLPSPGFWPAGLAFDGVYLWNLDSKQKKIFKIDPADGSILFAIDSPGNSPQGLAWDGKTLWVSDQSGDQIMKLDINDGTAVKIYPAPAKNPQGLTWDGQYLWCSDRVLDEIHMIDPDNGEVLMILKSPSKYPRGLAWDGKYLWNVDYQADSLFQLVRKDDQNFHLTDKRHAVTTFLHQSTAYGKGLLQELNVYLALPQNLPQQNILNISYNNQPDQTVTDKWGQNFAWFHAQGIKSGQTHALEMKIESEISDISYFIFPDRCGTLDDIPADIRKTFTSDGSKYLLTDPFIQEIAKKIVGDEKNPYWIARKIFDYVRNTLEYKLEGGWNVAPVVLRRGTGSCSEYTISFIALCRAAGLPARFVGSIVVRGDDASFDDVFHRWPEIYLPTYGWIPIDPQGGDKDLPRDRAMNIGHLSNRFLITTQSGGDSKYIGWYYNSWETYKADPQVLVNFETFAEWEPLN